MVKAPSCVSVYAFKQKHGNTHLMPNVLQRGEATEIKS